MNRALLLSFAIAASVCVAAAQDPISAFPKNYSLVSDNEAARVVRVHYGPHERIGVHDHSRFPTIYIYLNDGGPVRFEHVEKPPFSLTRPATRKGAFRVSPGRVERHSVNNMGETSSEFLRVELKQIPLGSSLHGFRGKAPSGRLQNSRAVEFESPYFDIQRVICEPGAPCTLDAPVFPSLLIAFSPLKVIAGDVIQGDAFKEGDVRWVEGPRALSIVTLSAGPAHLLRITFKTSKK